LLVICVPALRLFTYACAIIYPFFEIVCSSIRHEMSPQLTIAVLLISTWTDCLQEQLPCLHIVDMSRIHMLATLAPRAWRDNIYI
jgi:hypothetical protein